MLHTLLYLFILPTIQDFIPVRGEVYFPNLEFEKMEVDFACILNDTEVTRYINITNNSPMDVNYRWSFLIGDEPVTVFHKRTNPLDMAVLSEVEEDFEMNDMDEVHPDQPATPQDGVESPHAGEDTPLEIDIRIEGAESPVQEHTEVIKISNSIMAMCF